MSSDLFRWLETLDRGTSSQNLSLVPNFYNHDCAPPLVTRRLKVLKLVLATSMMLGGPLIDR